jgi:hypothetical protein
MLRRKESMNPGLGVVGVSIIRVVGRGVERSSVGIGKSDFSLPGRDLRRSVGWISVVWQVGN